MFPQPETELEARGVERFLALMRKVASSSEEEREELWRTYNAATRTLAEYGKLLTKGEVPPSTAQLAADAAAAVYEYLIAAAREKGEEAIAEVLARVDELLLVVLAARLAVREERGWL